MSTETLRVMPKQSRAQTRIESILDAARTHYAEVGRDRFNTGDVARLAGCSVGTVYRYFEDRVAILDAIDPNRDAANTVIDRLKRVDTEMMTEGQKWIKAREVMGEHGLL